MKSGISPLEEYRSLPRSIWALFAVRLVIAAGNFVFPFLTIILTTKLAWTADRTGTFLSFIQIAALPGVLFAGRLSDRTGRRIIILLCQAAAAILFAISLATGFTDFLPYLVGAASILLAMTWPVSGALVADLVPPERRKTAYALLYWGNNIGFSIGPIAAGFLLHRAPSLIFLGNMTALIISINILYRFVPAKIPAQATAVASAATASATAAATAAATATNDMEANYEGNLASVLKSRPTILIFAFIVALLNLVYSQHSFSLPLYLSEKMGSAGAEVFGAAMTVNGLTVVIFTLILSKITQRLPVLIIMVIAALLYAAGFGLLSFHPSLLLVLGSTVIWTWGEILGATNINVYIASRSPQSHRGRISSITSLVSNLGSLSGPIFAGQLIKRFNSAFIWKAAPAIALAAALFLLVLWSHDRAKGLQ